MDMVWCEMPETKKVGPYLFSKPALNDENQKMMPRYYGRPNIIEGPAPPSFREDGAFPHRATAEQRYLESVILPS